mgnify:CR=1 FL=1
MEQPKRLFLRSHSKFQRPTPPKTRENTSDKYLPRYQFDIEKLFKILAEICFYKHEIFAKNYPVWKGFFTSPPPKLYIALLGEIFWS